MSVYNVHAVHTEEEGTDFPATVVRELWAVMWVLGIELGSSGRVAIPFHLCYSCFLIFLLMVCTILLKTDIKNLYSLVWLVLLEGLSILLDFPIEKKLLFWHFYVYGHMLLSVHWTWVNSGIQACLVSICLLDFLVDP